MVNVQEDIAIVKDLISEKEQNRAVLIHALHKLQEEENYLPSDKLRKLSEKLDIPLSEVYSTASFYKRFYFTPRGKNIVCVCVGTACHVRGAPDVVNQLEESFGVKTGETASDLSVTLETVGCVGCCGLAPVVVVNNEIVGELTKLKVDEVLVNIKNSLEDYG